MFLLDLITRVEKVLKTIKNIFKHLLIYNFKNES
jgi:hypothetical protein